MKQVCAIASNLSHLNPSQLVQITPKKSLLNQVYANQGKVAGIEREDGNANQNNAETKNVRNTNQYNVETQNLASQQNVSNAKINPSPEDIYQQYLSAYKKGVFNFIKEDIDRVSKQPMPRKYFSGGAVPGAAGENAMTVRENPQPSDFSALANASNASDCDSGVKDA